MATEPAITFVRELAEPTASRQQFARAALRGTEVRLARGAYLSAEVWAQLDQRERYLARIRAVVETQRASPVISHYSAAAVHDLPVLGEWPREVHVSVPPAGGGRSRYGVVRHPGRLADHEVITVGGLRVTSPARTALDIAAAGSFLEGVLAVDRALHLDRRSPQRPPLATRAELFATWEAALPFRSFRRARTAIEFGVPLADSPLETVSRVTMMLLGCPKPRLQTRYFDEAGLIGEVDFDWPDYGVVGEADGAVKYLDPAYRSGRTAEQVLLDEKDRHDRLAALPKRVARWRYAVGVSERMLRERLAKAGLPMGGRW